MISLRRIGAFLLRHWYEIRRSLDRKADIIFFPIIDTLIFGFISVYFNRFGVKPGLAGMLLGGIIFWTLVYNIVRDLSFMLLEDTWSRNLYNLYATPLTLTEIIIGMLLMSVVKGAISTAIILFLAQGLFGFHAFALGPLVWFYIFSIFVFGWGVGFFTTSLILRFGTRVQAVAWSLILLIYPVSGVFYPTLILPKILANIAKVLPISYVFEGLRTLITGGTVPPGDPAIITILNGVYLIIGLAFFVTGFHNAKKRGWFIHPT